MTSKTRLFVLLLGVVCLFLAACGSSFVVNSEGDEGDADLANKACATINNDCTLRAAIQQANSDGNGALITFENVTTISPTYALPPLTGGAITIQGDGLVTIDGGQGGCGALTTGLEILGSNSNKIQGLTITNFKTGIRINGLAKDAQSNVIGPVWNSGGAASEGNVITANCNGIYIQGTGASGNTVMGNYIGVNADGFTANPNGANGVVLINGAHNNLIGGTAPSAAALIDPTDQAAYWTLDEGAGNRSDSVGSNTLTDNNAVLSAAGKINDAADFEASSSQFLAVADNPELSVGNIDFSFAGWVNLESKLDYGTILGRYESGAVRDYLLQHDIATDRFIFYLYDSAGTQIASVPASNLGAPSLNTWYFIVIWHDSVNDLIGIQVDNGAANTASTSGSAPGDTGASFRMGALFAGGPLQFFDGLMDEWGFWKRLLTSQEMTVLYNNGDGLPHDQGSSHESNVISANGSVGIYLGYDAHDNQISGNLIGTTLDGQTDLGNASGGIALSGDADNNVIGIGPNGIGLGNVISGNGYKGIYLQESDNNVIAGNRIGTNADGSAALGNDGDGISITINSHGNIIGTNGDGVADELEGNLISANGAFLSRGILINASAYNNVVAGNYIGTNFDGTSLLGNNGAGVTLSGHDNRIGTNGDGVSDALEANVISGNSEGVWIGGAFNDVSGNFIGTSADGLSPLGNVFSGVNITSTGHDNLIGTNGDGVADIVERNIISANAVSGGAGIQLLGNDNIIAGNYIGVDSAGTAALGNLQYGVLISASSGNLIGTDGDGMADAAERNVISGSQWMGLVLSQGASNNQVSGNYIGTNAAGTAALPNVAINEGVGAVQIHAGASNNVIGTNGDGSGDAAERNVISGNSRRGIQIRGQGTNNNTVAGNYIGTNAAGTAALGNAQLGVEIIEDATGNLIGTDGDGLSDALEANVISGNGSFGVEIFSASNNQVAGNFIGTDKTGTLPIPNGHDGVQLQGSNVGSTNGNTIGGSVAKRNVIAFNQGDGIELSGFGVDPLANPILFNSIFSNDGLGINLHPGNIAFNVTPNDVGDSDTGANNLMNFPVLDSALSINNAITISGDLVDSLANKSFQIQFFSSPVCDPTGYGEGQTYLGQSTQMTNGSGDVSFLVNFMVVVTPGSFITATATNANNTSEFSACVEVLAGSQFNLETTAQPPLTIVPLQDLNCRYFCTAQSEVADTLLRGIQHSPIGWDPTLRYLAFEGPTFGELCFAPPTTGGTELMSLQMNNQLITLDQLTLDMVPLFSCPAFATPTPTVDVDEGENATDTPVPPPTVPQCSDGIDNDGDGLTDYSAVGTGDRECRSANDDNEAVP